MRRRHSSHRSARSLTRSCASASKVASCCSWYSLWVVAMTVPYPPSHGTAQPRRSRKRAAGLATFPRRQTSPREGTGGTHHPGPWPGAHWTVSACGCAVSMPRRATRETETILSALLGRPACTIACRRLGENAHLFILRVSVFEERRLARAPDALEEPLPNRVTAADPTQNDRMLEFRLAESNDVDPPTRNLIR